MKKYIFLGSAIVFEVTGTTMLNLSEGFSNLMPTIAMAICFALSFTSLIFALKSIPLSLAYSVWAGLGTAGAGLIGIFLFDETLSPVNIIGLLVIIVGVVIMNMSDGTGKQVQ
ncbi:MAG TPA: QacE family quaternary ammonium compound efflux SMR transporter [Candidatus Salinicoccus stercoripullorum]|uniref:QacE family quaternary ammonium compound efflux SMR transporter n=1 Tax=Candidatus Salinicoccus stercoripullorum TaxID=2838756 RepID=A0A9D1QHF2_9STAP|nr:QacE family quaternary ammonium compound efflux SMR transporter [Candidatus Salinicoccus stercoripullorum]